MSGDQKPRDDQSKDARPAAENAADKHASGAPWRNFYGRFKGKTLKDSQKRYLDEDLASLSPGAVGWDENPDRNPLDLNALFGGKDVWLEVGFGGGEHLVHQAVSNPDVGIIGAEPFINGVAMLLGKIRNAGAGNIAVHPGDARDLMDVLPEASVSPGLPALSRPLAQGAPPPPPLCDAGASGAAGPLPEAGRDLPRGDRYPRLCAPDTGGGAKSWLRMAGRRAKRLAPAVG